MNEPDSTGRRPLSDWELAIEYGQHLLGVFPHKTGQRVTGVIAHNGNYFESYIHTGTWSTYPNWVREYEQTPLKDALEGIVEGTEIHTTECTFKQQYYSEEVLESVGLSGWRFEYERKRAFRKEVLKGEIEFAVPALTNRYGNIYTIPEYADEVIEKYWDFVDENYTHRHSHHALTKSNSDGVNS